MEVFEIHTKKSAKHNEVKKVLAVPGMENKIIQRK